MSRLWDTPDYWAQSEADEALREMPDVEPGALADSFERGMANYDDDPEFAALIIADLRRRAVAGIRFWPDPQPIVVAVTNVDNGGLIDDDIPW